LARLGAARGIWLGSVCALAWSVALMSTVSSARWAMRLSGDFQWTGAHLLLRRVDVYQVALSGHYDQILANQRPNYLPLLFELLVPLGAMPPSVAKAVWLVLNLCLYVAAAVAVGKSVRLSRWGLVTLVGAVLAGYPTGASLLSGQQTALCLLAAVVAAQSRRPGVSSAALAVMLTKYSFAPVALVALLRPRRITVLGTAAAIEVVALLTFCAVTGSEILGTAIAPLRVAATMGAGAGDVFSLTRGDDMAVSPIPVVDSADHGLPRSS
jgi:hypothetical protein